MDCVSRRICSLYSAWVRSWGGGYLRGRIARDTHVVLLSDDLWRRRFHADPHVVGKVIPFDSEGYQVLGVMPGGFNFPLKSSGNVQLPTDQMQFWVPLGADLAREPHGAPNAGVIARLKKGVSCRRLRHSWKRRAGCFNRNSPPPTGI